MIPNGRTAKPWLLGCSISACLFSEVVRWRGAVMDIYRPTSKLLDDILVRDNSFSPGKSNHPQVLIGISTQVLRTAGSGGLASPAS